MIVNDFIDFSGVAASHDDGHWQMQASASCENQLVSIDKALLRQIQTAVSIALIRIGSGQIDDAIGVGKWKLRNCITQSRQVLIVCCAIG
jgi:hypothetical protein